MRTSLPDERPQQPDLNDESPLQAFTADIRPARVSLFYRVGLAAVAFAMVLLPMIYFAVIALTAWGIAYHLEHNVEFLDHGGFSAIIGYLGPAAAGGVLIAFMVKPLFLRRPKAVEPVALDPSREPMLFAFIQRICRLVRT